jgi:DNA-binding winged helix-turn-helix (wHTH) protein
VTHSAKNGRIQFGTFDFDPSTRELRRDGASVRLQPQPAQVLACLLARPGEIVTRDELQKAVWGEGTFVDFDRNLNFCVAQIRSALGDSSESPLYIKTLPKRGYQFIAPVITAESAQPSPQPPKGSRKILILALPLLPWLRSSSCGRKRCKRIRCASPSPDSTTRPGIPPSIASPML